MTIPLWQQRKSGPGVQVSSLTIEHVSRNGEEQLTVNGAGWKSWILFLNVLPMILTKNNTVEQTVIKEVRAFGNSERIRRPYLAQDVLNR